MSDIPQRWRDIFKHRSTLNKIAVPRHCDLLDPEDLPAITSMVQGGVIEFIETATMPFAAKMTTGELITPISCDIYQVTAEGVELCERHRIPRR